MYTSVELILDHNKYKIILSAMKMANSTYRRRGPIQFGVIFTSTSGKKALYDCVIECMKKSRPHEKKVDLRREDAQDHVVWMEKCVIYLGKMSNPRLSGKEDVNTMLIFFLG